MSKAFLVALALSSLRWGKDTFWTGCTSDKDPHKRVWTLLSTGIRHCAGVEDSHAACLVFGEWGAFSPLIIRTTREAPGKKDETQNEKSEKGSQWVWGHIPLRRLWPRSGRGERGVSGCGGRHQRAWPGGREGGQVGESLWPQTRTYHSKTSACPCRLTLCLSPDTARPHCPAEPAVRLLPAARVPASSQAELERAWARWSKLTCHSWALCPLDPKIIFKCKLWRSLTLYHSKLENDSCKMC